MPEKFTAPLLREVIADRAQRHPDEPPQTTLRAAYTTLKHRLNAIDEEHPRLWAQQDAKQTQEVADKRQKVGNIIATGRYKPTPPPSRPP
jgi:hypothetical protein